MKKQLGTILRALVLASFLLNAVMPIQAGAAPAPAKPAQAADTPTPELSATPEATATLEATAPSGSAASATATDVAPTELSPTPADTGTQTATPEDTATPTLEATGTPVPTDTTQATVTPQASATSTPAPTQALGGYSLSLQSSPAFLPRGGTLSLGWTIVAPAGSSAALTLTFSLPAGVTPLKAANSSFDAASGTLTIQGAAQTGSLKLNSASTSDALAISASLLQGTTSLATAALTIPTREQFQLDKKGGRLSAMNGRVKVSFPAGVFSDQTLVQVGAPDKAEMPARSLSGRPFQLNARDNRTKKDVHQFSDDIALDVDYSSLDLHGASDGDVYVYWYNTATREWNALPSSADPTTHIVHAVTRHFTVFDIGVNNFQMSHLPTVDNFQVSGFTGAATYSMPIEVPAGPGGLQPSLSLNYNSQVIDQSTTQTQASWVGMGWSLDTGMMERNTHGTDSWGADDSYSLNVAGISTTVYAGTDGLFHAADETFMKFSYATDAKGQTYWTVWDKNGNIYTFANVVSDVYATGSEANHSCSTASLPYQWWLTSVENVHGQQLTYTYVPQTETVWFNKWNSQKGKCIPAETLVTTATYPFTIVYPGGRTRILFGLENRYDFSYAWNTDSAYHSFELYRLNAIYEQLDPNGDNTWGTLARKYQFSYYDPDGSNNVWPGYTWTGNGTNTSKTSTLKAVTQYGKDNASTLPATSFTYNVDHMHLDHATNGYGGSVEFKYNQDGGGTVRGPWVYTANARQSGTYIDSADCPGGFSSYYLDCGDNGMSLHGDAYNSTLLGMSSSQTLMRPGGVYSFSGLWSIDPDLDGVSYSITTDAGTFDSVLAADGTPIVTVSAASGLTTPWQVGIHTHGGQTYDRAVFRNITVKLLTSVSRVTTKTINDGRSDVNGGRGNSYAFSYAYANPAVNDDATSASAASCPDGSLKANQCWLNSEKYSEFRGHSQVVETGPDGHQVLTSYRQDDVFKGRTNWVRVKDAAGTLMTNHIYTYNPAVSLPVAALKVDQTKCYPCLAQPFKDVARYWITVASEENRTYAQNGTSYAASLKAYTYDDPAGGLYGNLVQADESSWDSVNSVWVLYRRRVNTYYPNNKPAAGIYLVGLPGIQSVKDPNNVVLSQTLSIYDDNTSYAGLPTAGVLSAVRTRINPSGQYSQVTYGYDSWGNRTDVTSYNVYGTNLAAPTSGGRTTTTTYDTRYHTYPVTQSDPILGPAHVTTWFYDYALGKPTQENDVNNNNIVAAYDVFGRLTQLIRPGDTFDNPTLLASYIDGPSMTVDVSQRLDTTNYYTVRHFYDGLGRAYKTLTGSGLGDAFDLYNATVSAFDGYGRVTSQSMPFTHGQVATYFTTTSYDALGRPLVVTAPDGSATTYLYRALKTTVTDAKGHATTTQNDVWGRTVSVTPPTGPIISYCYDPLGNLTSATRNGPTAADCPVAQKSPALLPYTTTIGYDLGGRKTSMSDPDMGNWTYIYDALGNLTSQTDARGCVLAMHYDLLSRLTSKSSSGNCGTQVSASYFYDETNRTNGLGRRTRMTDASGSTSWDYSKRGKVITETKTITGQDPFSTSTSYNSADLPLAVTYPDGEVVTNTYTPEMVLETVIGTNTGVDTGTSTYIGDTQYDKAGRMTSRVLGNGLTQTWNYYTWDGKDPSIPGDSSHAGSGGKLQGLVTGSLQNLGYTYDAVGNITQITNSVASETQGYTYDTLDRLTSWTLNGVQQEGYGYDGTTGNLNCKAGTCPQGTVTYTYDSNHLHAVSKVPDPTHPGTNNTYTYDADGNQITRTVGGVAYALGYDAEGHLVTVTGGSTSAQFTYDGDGSMGQAALTDANGTHTTTYVNASYQVTDSVVTKYYPGGAYRVGGTLYFSLTDQLGSTGVTTDASGVQVAELRYKPWGEVRTTGSSGTTPTDHTYTGQRSFMGDPSVGSGEGFGLIYYNARWYDPVAGRFGQADNIPVKTGSTEALDKFAYVSNNPINRSDPTGHKQVCTDRWDSRQSKAIHECHEDGKGPIIKPNTVPSGWDMNPLDPDYHTLTINGDLIRVVGITGVVTVDRYGQWYFGAGANVGKSLGSPSLSLNDGWIGGLDAAFDKDMPSPGNIPNFLTTLTINAGAGYVGGLAATISPSTVHYVPELYGYSRNVYDVAPTAVEKGVYLPPSAGISVTWSETGADLSNQITNISNFLLGGL